MTTAAAKTLEEGFEDAICRQLAERGWLYEPDAGSTGFDPQLALHTADALWWLRTRYPDEYVKAVPENLSDAERALAEKSLIDGLARSLNRKPTADRTKGGSRGGLMGTLRNGFSHKSMAVGTSATFDGMVSFPPANPMVDTVAKHAELNRLRVIRQVRFDTRSNETIDIVLLVNGVPVVTMELKTDNTQTIDDAETCGAKCSNASSSCASCNPSRYGSPAPAEAKRPAPARSSSRATTRCGPSKPSPPTSPTRVPAAATSSNIRPVPARP